MSGKRKVLYNYNVEQSNQLIKKGIFPIGCGINPKSGGFFLVFSRTQKYYETLKKMGVDIEPKQPVKDDNFIS